MGVYESWKKEVEEKISKFTGDEKLKEKIPAVIKRCPKCFNLSLEFDVKNSRIYCTKCGFEEKIEGELKMAKKKKGWEYYLGIILIIISVIAILAMVLKVLGVR